MTDELLLLVSAAPLLAGITIGILIGAFVASVFWLIWIYRAIEQ